MLSAQANLNNFRGRAPALRPMKKIAFAHGSCRDHYKLIADPRVEGGSAIEIKNTAFRSPGDSFVYPRIARLFLPFPKIARVLVRVDHVARFIVNANHNEVAAGPRKFSISSPVDEMSR